MPSYEIKLPTGEVYNVDSPSELTNEQLYAAVQSNLTGAKAPVGRGGILPSFAEQFATGFTSIPGGIAELLGAVGAIEKPEETTAAKFSKGAEQYIQQALGINPEATPTAAETGAGALGSLASFLVPGLAVAKGAKLAGAGVKAARLAGNVAAGVQAGSLGAVQQQQQMDATGTPISQEDRSKAILAGGAIGLTDLLPLHRFMGPLEAILAKVPLGKAGAARETIGKAVQKALVSATEEGAQEAFSQAAQNLVAQGIYDPNVSITDGLLANAGAGGFAGGTLDVILQLLAGRKMSRMEMARKQLKTTIGAEAKAGNEQTIRADAQYGLQELRNAAPIGNVYINRELVIDPETKGEVPVFHIVDDGGNKVATFRSADAAYRAAEQYEKDQGGLAKFNRPTVGDMAGTATREATPEEKAAGKKAAEALKAEGAFEPSPAATTTTPEGQAATADTVAKVAAETGASPDEITAPVARKKGRGRLNREAMVAGQPSIETPPPAPFEGLKEPEQTFPRPPERMTPEREMEMRAAGLSDTDLLAAGLGQPNQFSVPPSESVGSVPFMMTAKMRADLAQMGYSPEAIRNMTPTDAWAILNAKPQAAAAQPSPTQTAEPSQPVPPKAEAPTAPTPPTEITLETIRNALPKDQFGNADMGVLLDAIRQVRKGKPVPFSQLTKAEQIKVAKKAAPSLFPSKAELAKRAAEAARQRAAEIAQNPELAQFVPSVDVAFRPSEATAEGRAAAKAYDERLNKIVEEVNKALAPMGLKNVRVQFSNFLKAKTKSGQEVSPQGYVNEAGDIIYLATNIYDPKLTDAQNAQKVVEIMNHEVIHSLVNLGLFKPGEFKTLSEAVGRLNYPGTKFTYLDRALATYGSVYTNADGSPNMEMIAEEGVAEMFRDWNAGRLKLVGKPQGLFQRMLEFIKRLFRGMKNAKVEDIFRSIKGGEFGARESRPSAAGETKFAVPKGVLKGWEKIGGRTYKRGDWTVFQQEDGTWATGKGDSYGDPEGFRFHSRKHKTLTEAIGATLFQNRVERKAAAGETKFATAPNLIAYDNPATSRGDKDWLARKQAHAEEKMAKGDPETASGKGLYGPATAYTRRPIDMNVDFVSQLPGAEDEKRIPGEYKFDALLQKVKKEGWTPTPIMILVNHRGDAYITEGNTRAAVAKSLGIETIPAEIQWINGAELSGRNTPDDMLANSSGPPSGETKFAIPAQLTGESEQEFRDWFKQSKATDRKGNPRVFYNGRTKPLREGQFGRGASGALEGESGPFFFSPESSFAEEYAMTNLSKGGDRKKVETGVMYPAYLSTQNPWDYRSSFQVDDVIEHIADRIDSGELDPKSLTLISHGRKEILPLRKLGIYLERGEWDAIELPAVQRAIRDLGHDGFYLVENGVRNIAVYNPEQIKSVFNQFPPGTATSPKFAILPRALEDWATSGSPPPGVDSQNINGISPYRISQRRPSGPRALNPLQNDLEISMEAMKAAQGAWQHNSTVVLRSYDIMPAVRGESGDDTARRFIRHIADNLLFLHDLVPAAVRSRSKLWYDGAREITTRLSKQYNLPDSAVAAVIAAESPQKDWYQNVSLADRIIDTVRNKADFEFTQDMLEKAQDTKSLKNYEDAYRLMYNNKATLNSIEGILRRNKGNMLASGELTEDEFRKAVIQHKALFVRLYDEQYRPRDYNIVSPEGNMMGLAKTKSGENAKVAWGSLKTIGNAISVIEDPSKENINQALGGRHKVRNFYNNIISPNAGSDITSDTHAVAAGFIKPFGGSAEEVHHNFGTGKEVMKARVKNSGPHGVQGTYGLIADAYRLAASERGILPREMQSITWEAIRSLFKPEMRRNRKLISLVNDIWKSYADGRIDINTARQNILEAANAKRGLDNPSWWSGSDTVNDENVPQADDAGNVRPDELGIGSEAGGLDSGTVVRNSIATAEQVAQKANKRVNESRTFGGEDLGNFASVANKSVKDAVSKLSIAPIDAPLPPILEAANGTLFAQDTAPRTVGEKIMGFFGGLGSTDTHAKFADNFRVQFVQKEGQHGKRQREAYLSGVLPLSESRQADYDTVAAMDMYNRSSHFSVMSMKWGAGVIKMYDPRTGENVYVNQGGDPNSMTFHIEDDTENSPEKIIELLIDSGPNGTSLLKGLRSYLTAQVSQKRLREGKPIRKEITPQYIAAAEQLATQHPQIKEAYERYQKFNMRLMTAARDSGFINNEQFHRFTDDMNYYPMYSQFEEEAIVPGTAKSIGTNVKIREYTGGGTDPLMGDPIVAMMHNVSFWNSAILKNIASQKALRVGEATGLMTRLKTTRLPNGNLSVENPDTSQGYVDKIFYTKINGESVPFATKDPLLAVGLMSSPQANLEGVFKYLGLPTSFLREMVTRDPGFMIANLLRDSMSTWTLAGSGANPLGTFTGFVKALRKTGSYDKLRSLAVIGSFDEAQKSPEKYVAGFKAKLTKAQGLDQITGTLKRAWDGLEKLSEASDAATRIAVYDAAKKAGASDFTAAYRSLMIMNFSRSGASAGVRIMSKLIPFLNARIQGFDVLYTGIKSAAGVVTGAPQLDFERQRGTAVLYRGMGLMAAAMALAMINDDDEDYKQLPQYIKDSNILIPTGGGKFISIPKPFEAGLLFMTIPTTVYDMASGNRSMRSGLNLFYNQFSSTFGFNPIPQFALPVLENVTNRDFYTGLPLISAGQEKLDPSLQYNASTSYLARAIGKAIKYTPMGYNFETGRFEGSSPILIDNLISGYGGPIASYLGMAVGGISNAFGSDNEGLPVAASNMPVIRRFFIDAQDKQPQATAEAYDLYQQVDKVNRTVSRLKKMGDFEALKEYRAENIDMLRVGKQVRKMADNLNNLRAQLRRLEADKTMSGQEKLAKMRELRSREITLTNRIDEINRKLGR